MSEILETAVLVYSEGAMLVALLYLLAASTLLNGCVLLNILLITVNAFTTPLIALI